MLDAAANYALFVYMEDDLHLTWPALQAWAYDEGLLAPLGFHRGFVRTEVAHWDGHIMAFEQPNTVSIPSSGQFDDDNSVLRVASPMQAEHIHLSGNAMAQFVRLHDSYMAMWLGSRTQVAEWLQAPEWSARLNRHGGLIREDAAWNLYTVERGRFKKEKHKYSLLVPYAPRTATIAKIATLPHLSNIYCSRETADAEAPHSWCRIRFKDVLGTT